MSKLIAPWTLPLGQARSTDAPGVTATTTTAPAPATPAVEATTRDAATTIITTQPSTQQANTQQDGAPKKNPGFFEQLGIFPLLIVMLVVMYVLMLRPQRKEEKRRKQMIADMKKGDKVMTIGGQIGRIVSIDNNEVVLKIDESANVKATFTKAAVQQVLVPEEEKSK